MCYEGLVNLTGGKIQTTPTKQDLVFFLKIFDEHPVLFIRESRRVTSESILRYFTVFLAHGGGEKEDISIIV